VVGYGPFSLWVIHKEGLCPSSGDINRLMMMMMMVSEQKHLRKKDSLRDPLWILFIYLLNTNIKYITASQKRLYIRVSQLNAFTIIGVDYMY
jgi:hypothetical protein